MQSSFIPPVTSVPTKVIAGITYNIKMQTFFARMTLAILFLLVGSPVATAATGISVWPIPSEYSSGSKVLWIADDVKFAYKTAISTVLLLSSPNFQIVCADDRTFSGEHSHLR